MFRQTLTISGLMLLLALFAGCGSDKGGTNPPPVTAVRVTVASAATTPSLTSVDDPVWTNITPTQIDITQSIFAARRASKIASMSDSVKVQAAQQNGNLWIRLQWKDNTHNVWRDAYQVTAVDTLIQGVLTPVWFTSLQDVQREDEAVMLFSGLGTNLRDVWSWRALTTDVGLLAEGMKLEKIGQGPDSLILTSDAVTGGLTVAHSNYYGPNVPVYVHIDTSEFKDYRLYLDPPTLTSVFVNTHGWTVGQRVPGYLIDSSIYSRQAIVRGSRWDIRAVSKYDSVAQQYTVVMMCPMHTGYTDDIDFQAVDSVETQVGLFDNEVLIQAGQFTKKFWLIF